MKYAKNIEQHIYSDLERFYNDLVNNSKLGFEVLVELNQVYIEMFERYIKEEYKDGMKNISEIRKKILKEDV